MPLKTKCIAPLLDLTQIAANSLQDLIPPKSRKVYDFYMYNAPEKKYLAAKVKLLSSLEGEL
jgi:hypothetical protein